MDATQTAYLPIKFRRYMAGAGRVVIVKVPFPTRLSFLDCRRYLHCEVAGLVLVFGDEKIPLVGIRAERSLCGAAQCPPELTASFLLALPFGETLRRKQRSH